MFYKNISYIDVLVSDEQAFEAFLDWTEERDIVVSKIAINSDNEVTIYMSNWALQNNFVLFYKEMWNRHVMANRHYFSENSDNDILVGIKFVFVFLFECHMNTCVDKKCPKNIHYPCKFRDERHAGKNKDGAHYNGANNAPE